MFTSRGWKLWKMCLNLMNSEKVSNIVLKSWLEKLNFLFVLFLLFFLVAVLFLLSCFSFSKYVRGLGLYNAKTPSFKIKVSWVVSTIETRECVNWVLILTSYRQRLNLKPQSHNHYIENISIWVGRNSCHNFTLNYSETQMFNPRTKGTQNVG